MFRDSKVSVISLFHQVWCLFWKLKNNKIDLSHQIVPGIHSSLPLKLVARTDSTNISMSFHKAQLLNMQYNGLVPGTCVVRAISVDSHQDTPVHFSMWDLHARSDTSKWLPIPGSCSAATNKVALYGLASKNGTRYHICVNINDLVCAQGLVKVCNSLELLVICPVNKSLLIILFLHLMDDQRLLCDPRDVLALKKKRPNVRSRVIDSARARAYPLWCACFQFDSMETQ